MLKPMILLTEAPKPADDPDAKDPALDDKGKGAADPATEDPPADNPDHRKAYSTPLIIDVAGRQQVVSSRGQGRASRR